MTLNEAITKADELRPNALPYVQKRDWVLGLNGEFARMMGEEIPDPEDDMTLLMGAPYEEVYVFYLCAVIDWGQEDMALYQNDWRMAQSMISEAKSWYRRENGYEYGENKRGRLRGIWR